MSKSVISILFVICAMSLNICYGMEEQKNAKKKGSKSYFIKRKKGEKKDVIVNRRQSESSALDALKEPEEEKVRTRHRTFSLLPKLKLKPKPKSVETGSDEIASAPKTPHSSVPGDDQNAQQVGIMLALSRKVASSSQPPVESAQSAAPAPQRMSVTVPVPTLNGSQETVFELKEVLVSPQKVESAPAVNTAQRVISRKASLLRVVYQKGRSGRDSQTKMTAKEYLGTLGEAALFANPSPGQSPRSEDTVTPRSEEAASPRSDDTLTPRSDDAASPRVDEEK